MTIILTLLLLAADGGSGLSAPDGGTLAVPASDLLYIDDPMLAWTLRPAVHCPESIFSFTGFGPCPKTRGADSFELFFERGRLVFLVKNGAKTYRFVLRPESVIAEPLGHRDKVKD